MKKRIYWLAAALLVVAAAGFFSGRHIYLHGELPRTVENMHESPQIIHTSYYR